MAPTGTTLSPDDPKKPRTPWKPKRPLFDSNEPYGIARYSWYTPHEVGWILCFGPDYIRKDFADGKYGKVLPVPSGRTRRWRKNYVSLRIYYEAVIGFIRFHERSA